MFSAGKAGWITRRITFSMTRTRVALIQLSLVAAVSCVAWHAGARFERVENHLARKQAAKWLGLEQAFANEGSFQEASYCVNEALVHDPDDWYAKRLRRDFDLTTSSGRAAPTDLDFYRAACARLQKTRSILEEGIVALRSHDLPRAWVLLSWVIVSTESHRISAEDERSRAEALRSQIPLGQKVLDGQ